MPQTLTLTATRTGWRASDAVWVQYQADKHCMSVISAAGKVLAGVASASVLVVAGVAAVSQHSMFLTPGDVDVVSGLSPTQASAQRPVTSLPKGDAEAFNVLLLGSDTREGQGSGFGSADVYTGARSDTAMLLHVPADRENATVVSFPRDLRVDVPACGDAAAVPYARFNVAFEVGGAGCTATVVETLTGMQVDHIVVVDFNGFRTVVDALGGLRVCLTMPVTDDASNLDLPMGWQTLDGEDALALARARKNLADGSDIARIDRQQRLLETAYSQVLSDGVLTNPAVLYGFLSAVGDAVTVSPSLSTTAAQVELALQMSSVGVSSIRFVTVPWVPAGDGQTVELNVDAASVLFDRLRNPGASTSEGGRNGGSADDTASRDDSSASARDAASSGSRDGSVIAPTVPADVCRGEGII